MRRAWIAGPIALAGAGALLLALPVGAQETPAGAQETPDAATLFEQRCSNCHTVPDRAIATDRAWLDQVQRTA